jgi:lipid A 3-O-deacylase
MQRKDNLAGHTPMRTPSFLLAATAAFFLSTAAQAGEQLALGAGVFDIFNDDDDAAVQFSGEYRGDYIWEGLRPVIGVSANLDGGWYGYGGGNYDFFLGDSLVLTPNFVVGAYHNGGSKDLGGPLEFRSGIELGYEFDNASRASVAFNHISNASIYDQNPGAESLMFMYSHPIYIWGD